MSAVDRAGETVAVDAITTGERDRTNLGDIDGLAGTRTAAVVALLAHPGCSR